jgi:YidC/Oxa1 family membrane protein insertase
MKLTPRVKKLLAVLAVLTVVITLTGCTVPRNEDGSIVLIQLDTTFNQIMESESWFSACFVWPLAEWINHLAPVIGVGGAIALVTLVVNGVLAVLTLKSTVSMQQMQLVQPELEKIQRKYEGRNDDTSKMRQASEMQALYKKYEINPASSLLVTFLQFPIIMAMYMAVQRSYSVATGSFMGMDLQATPLAGMQSVLNGSASGWMYVILFVFMGVCQYFSMSIPQMIQKKKAAEEAEKHHTKPEKTSKANMMMQYYMMAMIMVFGLMWPAAMSLYWAINSIVNIIKTLLVQKYIDNRKAKKEGAH